MLGMAKITIYENRNLLNNLEYLGTAMLPSILKVSECVHKRLILKPLVSEYAPVSLYPPK
jgi:uncharacterized UPF0146 family protein